MTAFSSLETEIVPFRVAIPEAAVTDLRERLAMSRFPHDTAGGWVHGQSVELMRELAAAWHGFDWRAAEARLNAYPQFTTRIDGQTIHFVHVKSTEPNAFPLILTHGWPSTYFEYYDVIERLTDPRSHGLDPSLAFDLVIPSIPGYGFSTPLETPGWNSLRIARAWDQLMKRLGYQRYGAQGGDTGSIISQELGVLAPEGLAGVHVQQIFAFPTGAPGEMEKLSPFEQEGFANLETYLKYDGYRAIQEKRPGTLGFGLVDSPVALLAWNAELFFGFEGEGVERVDRQASHPCVDLLVHRHRAVRRRRSISRMRSAGPERARCSTPPRRASQCSPGTSARCAALPSAATISCTGRRCRAAGTLPRWMRRTCWSRTCATSSGRCAECEDPASEAAGGVFRFR